MLPAIGIASQEHAFTLKVTDNLRPGAKLYVAVYTEQAHSWQSPILQKLVFTLPSTTEAEFSLPLPPGRYAVKAFVDENENQILDRKNQRTPVEPFGFSLGDRRNKPSFRFTKSVATLNADSPAISLQLQYPQANEDTVKQPEP